jgi:hypothetical protein
MTPIWIFVRLLFTPAETAGSNWLFALPPPAGDPSPVNVNYILQLDVPTHSQCVTAAKLIAGAVDFKLKLDR